MALRSADLPAEPDRDPWERQVDELKGASIR
jgi:hypothetical protein